MTFFCGYLCDSFLRQLKIKHEVSKERFYETSARFIKKLFPFKRHGDVSKQQYLDLTTLERQKKILFKMETRFFNIL